MIGADRRGHMVGYVTMQGCASPGAMSVDALRAMAASTLEGMRKDGFAHLDPEQDFIDGFVEGFREAIVLLSDKEKTA